MIGRLSADRDLMQALPGRLKKAIADLHPTGTFGLRGSFDLASKGQVLPTITSGWNLNLDLHQSNLNCGVPLKNINGGVTLVGAGGSAPAVTAQSECLCVISADAPMQLHGHIARLIQAVTGRLY